MKTLINLLTRNYQYFLSVAKHGSITEASKALRIGQPALSLAMDQLEAEVGISLFEKRGRRRVISATGEAFAKVLGNEYERLADVCARALNVVQAPLVRIGVVSHWALQEIIPDLVQLETRFGISQCYFGYSLHILEQVQAGLIDIGLISWTHGAPKWRNRIFVGEDPYAIIGLKGKYDFIHKSKDRSELKDLPWIWHRKPQYKISNYLGTHDRGIVVDGYEVMKALLFQGAGIAEVQLKFFTPKELSRFVMAPIRLTENLGLYLVYADDLSPQAKSLLDHLKMKLSP